MKTAAILRLTLALQVGAGALVAALAGPREAARWAPWVCGASIPVLLTGLSIGLQLAIDAAKDPRRPRTSMRHVMQVWIGECAASLACFCWLQPFRAGYPEPAAVRDASRPAVLLIHGYACNRGAWLPLVASQRLAAFNVATLDLEPMLADIDGYATAIHEAIGRLRAKCDAPRVTLVCHSMGGLAARAYLRAYGDAQVDRLITIATPHRGTIFARLGRGPNAKQMIFGSDWIAQLQSAMTPAWLGRQVHIGSLDDNLIHPRSSLALPGVARVHWLDGVGHLAMLTDERVWNLVADEVAAQRHPDSSAPDAIAAGRG
ncbi:MAG TPA: alpha/beta fold hydrolase [Burkholderiaceae bacterium]|nr:alpha/beta fold hydrolase [Burkholderiaceae bacterium]